jgi:flagellar biosynthesis protein FliP
MRTKETQPSISFTYQRRWGSAFLFICGVALCFLSQKLYAEAPSPTFSINIGDGTSNDGLVPAIKIVLMLTVLTVAPAILLMTTSFTRIVVVLGFVRQALGAQNMPPNQVIVGLALFLTFFTMLPVWKEVNENAITQEQALTAIANPLRKFMLGETRESDLEMFFNVSRLSKPKNPSEVTLPVLIPAFMVSELKTAFQIGFMVYIPFLIIDMVVSSILMAMGMMMLPPTVVSLPFKLVLFVLVDGWSLVIDSLVHSFQAFS